MKKGLLIICMLFISAGAAMAYGEVPTNFINEVNGLGNMNVHDMQYIKDNEFRHREYNDYKDMKEQKEAKNKQYEVTEPAMKRIFNRREHTDIQFVEKDGEIRIQGVE